MKSSTTHTTAMVILTSTVTHVTLMAVLISTVLVATVGTLYPTELVEGDEEMRATTTDVRATMTDVRVTTKR